MPRLSMFYGIVIALCFNDHAPPHFHAVYGEHEGRVAILDLTVMPGSDLPRRAERLTLERAALHRDELLSAWARAQRGEAPGTIEPLP